MVEVDKKGFLQFQEELNVINEKNFRHNQSAYR